MPNITIYLDNKTYIGFLKLSDKKRTSIRKDIADGIKEEVENVSNRFR